MAETAELVTVERLDIQDFIQPIDIVQSTVRQVEAVPDLPLYEHIRTQAAEFIGAVTMGHEVDFAPETISPIESLYDAVIMAAEGNKTALEMVKTNVRTDVIERTIKAGHIMKVDLMVDEAGQIMQHGQSIKSVHANSLLFASNSWQMRERTEAETTNAFSIQRLYEDGQLEDNYFVVPSLAADNMTQEQMDKAGFFTETMSCALQATTAEDGKVTTESAFVAGVKQPGAERHDIDVIKKIYKLFGHDAERMSAAQILATPLKIPKAMMPNGVVDLVKLYDVFSGGTFFGEDKPQQDYQAYRQQCQRREAEFEPKVEIITRELLDSKGYIKDRLHAARLLNKISGRNMVEHAVLDESINPWVFGAKAAPDIVLARRAAKLGDKKQAKAAIRRAQANETSSPCPNGLDDPSGVNGGEDQYGSLNFDCPNGHSNTRPKGQLLATCGTCGTSVAC